MAFLLFVELSDFVLMYHAIRLCTDTFLFVIKDLIIIILLTKNTLFYYLYIVRSNIILDKNNEMTMLKDV